MSADRAYRIWKKAGLQVPRRRPRRRVATGRPRPLPATGANQVWAYDFVFDACANGPEFISRAVLQWLNGAGIDTAPIDPGKPWQNGANESFNGKFRDECLGMQWFKNKPCSRDLGSEETRQVRTSEIFCTPSSTSIAREAGWRWRPWDRRGSFGWSADEPPAQPAD
ncbi:MAG: transposase [Deltaproteobacteria bacterium]|nr:transposase [Deltaproteobacteria bacterium]